MEKAKLMLQDGRIIEVEMDTSIFQKQEKIFPQKGDKYWALINEDRIEEFEYPFDNNEKGLWNCFKTKKECEKYAERRYEFEKALNIVKRWIEKNGKEGNWFIRNIDSSLYLNDTKIGFWPFKKLTKQVAKRLLFECEKELITIFNYKF